MLGADASGVGREGEQLPSGKIYGPKIIVVPEVRHVNSVGECVHREHPARDLTFEHI